MPDAPTVLSNMPPAARRLDLGLDLGGGAPPGVHLPAAAAATAAALEPAAPGPATPATLAAIAAAAATVRVPVGSLAVIAAADQDGWSPLFAAAVARRSPPASPPLSSSPVYSTPPSQPPPALPTAAMSTAAAQSRTTRVAAAGPVVAALTAATGVADATSGGGGGSGGGSGAKGARSVYVAVHARRDGGSGAESQVPAGLAAIARA